MPIALFAILFLLALFIGMPMAAAFAGAAILPNLFDPAFAYNAESAVRSMVGSLDSFPLLAIPLFMFSGVIMAKGGISEKLFSLFAYFFGKSTAGYPIAVIVTCLFYGAISGSGPATTAAVGAMTIPFLVKRGYSPVFSASLVAVAGGLGVIIPPSIPMIAYSTITGASVSSLFVAGIFPGILIALCLMAYAWFYCKKNGEDKELLKAEYEAIRARGFWKVLRESVWALLAPVIILGGIYGGIASPTEAAALSVYYALFVSFFIYRSLHLRDLKAVLRETVRTYASILFIIACAVALSRVITLLQISSLIERAVLSSISSRTVLLLLINVILLFAGMIMDPIPAMMIFTPVILPIATQLGMHPVHLGILMVVNLAIGFVTPPLGVNLFVASNMTKIPVLRIAKAAIPFILAFLAALLLITFVPQISMLLVG